MTFKIRRGQLVVFSLPVGKCPVDAMYALKIVHSEKMDIVF